MKVAILSSMSEDYIITGHNEHYACMVDLLGRAGYLEKRHMTLSTVCHYNLMLLCGVLCWVHVETI
jgi:hypothetical protein